MFQLFIRMLQLFHFDVLKVDQECCACCNVSHLSQPPAAATGAPCMEESDAAGVEGCGNQGSVREWCERAPPMRAVGAGAVSGRRGSVRTSGR